MVFRPPNYWSNWKLEMLVLEERGKPESTEKNLLKKITEQTINSAHIWSRR